MDHEYVRGSLGVDGGGGSDPLSVQANGHNPMLNAIIAHFVIARLSMCEAPLCILVVRSILSISR